MQFKKYNSIENSYQESFVFALYRLGFGEHEFVVQEKVHGANLSFITDGTKIMTAKRSGLIEKGEVFYNFSSVEKKYQNPIFSLYQELSDRFHCKTITIFGEIFGGGYPHPDVAPDENAVLVQRGVYYSPENDFYAFDILLDDEKYLPVDVAVQLFEKHGFLYAKTLFKGKLKECLKQPNKFKTMVPKLLGLPELEGNICEGVVVRPVEAAFLNSGARVMLKNKNEKWAENNKQIGQDQLNKLLKTDQPLSDDAKFLYKEIHKLITQNRLDNLIGKMGEVDPKKMFGKIQGLFNKDVLEEFMKTHGAEFDALEKHERKTIKQSLNIEARKLIQNHFYG